MRKIAFIFSFLMLVKIYAQEINNTKIENEIIKNKIEVPKDFYKNLYQVQTKLMSLENKINYLNFILQDKLNNNEISNKLDPIEKLQRARRHLLLGNSQSAINEVNRNFKYIDFNDDKNKTLAYKILFEAYRIQGNYLQSANICSKMILLDLKSTSLFEDKWKMLCSYSFMQASKSNLEDDFKNKLLAWSLNPFVSMSSKYSLLSKTFIALALRNEFKKSHKGLDYLQSSIANAKDQDVDLGKSYLVLALMYYEKGERDKAFSIIQDLSLHVSLEKTGYKYFHVDNYTRILAELSFARLHSVYGNLQAAQTWYDYVLKEKQITGFDFEQEEKNNIKFEYAQVLYKLKEFNQSALILKQILTESSPIDLLFGQYNIKISKIILANILGKSPETSEKSYNELIKLLKMAKYDLNFIKENNNQIDKDYDSMKKKFIILAALSKDYGLDSKEAQFFIHNYISIEKLTAELPSNKLNFINAMNSIDYKDSGVSESIVLSCIDQINENFDKIFSIMIDLDKFSSRFFDIQSKSFQVKNNNRNELIRRLFALNDNISLYKNDIVLGEDIYKKEYIDSLIKENNKFKKLKSEFSNINFLNLKGIDSIQEKKNQIFQNILSNSIEIYRISLIKNEIFPLKFYSMNKKIDVYNETLSKLFVVDKSSRMNGENLLNENYNNEDIAWSKLIELNNRNIKLLKIVTERLNINRKNTLKKIMNINEKIKIQEDSIKIIKDKSYETYKKYYPILSNQLYNKIQEFIGIIEISLAIKDKNMYEFEKLNLNDEIEIKKEREKWNESLQKSLEWGLFR